MLATETATQITTRPVVSELVAMREISKRVNAGGAIADLLDATSEIVLGIPGLQQLELKGSEVIQWGQMPDQRRSGSAVSEVTPQITLRLWFDLDGTDVESPVKMVRFLAQQIRTLLTLSDLRVANLRLRSVAYQLGAIVSRRKAIHRATAMLSRKHQLAEADALLLLRRYGRSQKCALHEIATAIVTCEVGPRCQARRLAGRRIRVDRPAA